MSYKCCPISGKEICNRNKYKEAGSSAYYTDCVNCPMQNEDLFEQDQPSKIRQELLCDRNCNECPIINHPNARMITAIFNRLINKYDLFDEVYDVVQNLCPNLTVCYDCRIDDFCHSQGCNLIETEDEERTVEW
jgi:hypothetical protein